jgi:hypothetical protein
VVHDRLEVVLHQPLLDQVWLRERVPSRFVLEFDVAQSPAA